MTGGFEIALIFPSKLTADCCADRLTGSALSLDATHLACGFQESHIRLWNLKGEKFRPYRSDFDARDIKDGKIFP